MPQTNKTATREYGDSPLSAEKPSLRRRIGATNGAGLIFAFLLLFVGLSIANEQFFTLENMMTVLRQAVFVAIVAYGMTFVIAMGGIDLSVGAIIAVSGVVVAHLMTIGVNIYLAIVAALISGIVVGAISGVFIAVCGIPDFIVTMAMMSVVRGAVQVFTKGVPIYGLAYPEFAFLAQGYLGPLPFPILLAVIMFVICYYVLNHTSLGRYVISVGSNVESARLVGIRIRRIKIIVYSICGLMAAFSGVLITSRLTTAVPDAGTGYEMDAIAATVIGGTSLSGGKATLFGTALGAVLMALVRNGLNILNINTFWHQVVIGTIVLIAVGMDVLSTKYSGTDR